MNSYILNLLLFCRGIEELESLQTEFHISDSDPKGVVDQTKSLLKIFSEFLTYPLYKAATFVLLWKLFSIAPRKACVMEGVRYNEDPRFKLFKLLNSHERLI